MALFEADVSERTWASFDQTIIAGLMAKSIMNL